MRVWIENPFDNLPLEGFRPQRFWLMAQAFAAAGHDVTLWTSDFNHTTKRRRASCLVPRDSCLVPRDSCNDLRSTRHEARSTRHETIMVPTIPYSKNVSLRRMFSHWRYAKTWEKMARRYAAENGRPDVIVVSTPPLSTGAAARRMAKDFGSRLVFDVMDAWPETFERVAPRWALAPLRRLAKANYLSADLVTTVADRYIELVRSYGYKGPAQRFYHGIEIVPRDSCLVPRASCLGERSPTAKHEPRSTKHEPRSTKLAYIGNLGQTYDLETVIKAMELLPDATLEIAGQGCQEPMLRRAASENPRIVFRGYLGEEDLNALLERCDIGIVPMAPESCVGVPYKFADYARAGLAIVSSLGGESGKLLDRYGAGAAYRAGDPASLANAITRIAASLENCRVAALRLSENEFAASTIYPAYVSAVEAIYCSGN